ncbi:hypothetical protein TL16_g12813 [Triparma laevis f. inornata]|uniref:Uncharacterized protein n=2 Tax=Triparma laevis TaxID=1534972 RepID=A0A9W7AW06_9STRA|nr:hypothetical protein TrLO_g8403 [Triparma laevis f. longispina]GMH94119.1 hypothetical protein TL16_g12813 [Triparma laevis f. inornata]
MPLYSSNRKIDVNFDVESTSHESTTQFPTLQKRNSWTSHKANSANPTTPKMPYSKVVEGLTHSQGSIALISALLSGFAFQTLTTMTVEYSALSDMKKVVYVIFSLLSCLTISSFLFVAVSCSMLEQEGLVARSLSISTLTSPSFDENIKTWYFDDEEFVSFRGRLIFVFNSSFILFTLFCAAFCPLRINGEVGWVCGGVFLVFGVMMGGNMRVMNRKFVEGILKKI